MGIKIGSHRFPPMKCKLKLDPNGQTPFDNTMNQTVRTLINKSNQCFSYLCFK